MRHFSVHGFGFIIGLALIVGLASISPRKTEALAAKTVIVQLSKEPVVVAKYRAGLEKRAFDADAYKQQVIAEQEEFLQRATAAGIPFTIAGVSAPNGPVTADIKFRFNYVYNGITLVVPEQSIAALEGLPNVTGVYEAMEVHPVLDHAVEYIRAPQLYANPPKLSQFDQLNTGGVHGEGMTVAVIDTGVDWTHAMFGGDPTPPQFGVGPAVAAAGPNKKVIYYLNLTAGAALDDFGHGTHVAADIAGYQAVSPTSGSDGVPYTGPSTMIHGVAPQAKIMAYKVLSAVGAGLNPSTILAIEDAVQPFTLSGYPKPVPQVINLSLGSDPPAGNNPDFPTSVACDNATLAGVTIVASASNSGRPGAVTPDGEATIGSPGAGRRVITVGANNDPGSLVRNVAKDLVFVSGNPPDTSDVLDPSSVDRSQTGLVDATNKPVASGQKIDMALGDGGGSPYIASPIAQYYVFAGTVTTAADVPDSVAGRIAIARGSGAFATVAAALAAKGAAGALLIRPTAESITVIQSTIPVRSIAATDAAYLLDLLSSTDDDTGEPAKGSLSEFPIRLKAGAFQPAMADFSSKGPVGGYGQIKPDITAPGVNILSATIHAGGVSTGGGTMFDPTGFISASGTSFSSPITAGAAALIKQKHLNWTPAMIRAALINTATNLRQANGTPLPDGANTLNEQGGGLIDVVAAANAKALMGTGAPGPSGSGGARAFAVGLGPLRGTSPGNPDFSASYSFGQEALAGVIGTSTQTQTVNIYDVSNGAGAGVYDLSAGRVRFVDGNLLRVTFTDATGNDISSVTVPANGSATFNVNLIVNGENLAAGSQVQWYVSAIRADGGQRLRMPFYLRAIAPTVSTAAPNLNAIGGNEVAGTPPVDVDGNYQLQYAASGAGTAPAKFRLQESSNGGTNWVTMADVPASQTSFDVTNKPNGNYLYRVIGLVAVENGLYPSAPSASQAVTVDHRTEFDVTSMINAVIVDNSLSFSGGVTQFDQVLKNTASTTTIYPPLRFTIVTIQSNSGRVRVANADNSGDGVAMPALFDYTSAAGFDLTPNESSGARHLTFNNPAMEMFTFTAVVRGSLRDGGGASSAGQTAGSSTSSSSGTSGSGSGTGVELPVSIPQGKTLSFTVNPLTRTVQVKLF